MSQFSLKLFLIEHWLMFFLAGLGQGSGTAPSEGLYPSVLLRMVSHGERDISHPPEAFSWNPKMVWGSEGLKSQVGEAQILLGLGGRHWRTSREK